MEIRGIGVDAASIARMRSRIEEEGTDGIFFRHTFSVLERENAKSRPDKAEYFAARFSAKEAVFKALDGLLGEDSFDFRMVETVHDSDGRPQVRTDGGLRPYLERCGVRKLFLSVSTEENLAISFVVAWG